MSLPNMRTALNPGSIKFIYFDLDDTLIDHKTAQNRALLDVWAQIIPLQKVEPGRLTEVYGATNDRLWNAYRKHEIDKSALRRLRLELTLKDLKLEMLDSREIESVYLESYMQHWEWVDGVREGFLTLSQKYPVGVMTDGFIDMQKLKFEHFSLHRFSQHLIISEEVGHLKPDPRIFDYAAKKAGWKPAEYLFVGDSHTFDIMGGSQSGWKTAWFNRDGNSPPSRIADLTFYHFSQLVKALV